MRVHCAACVQCGHLRVRPLTASPGCRYRVTSSTTKIASALGGLIYLVLPDGSTSGMQNLTITGAAQRDWKQMCKCLVWNAD
jgi:hypothetical protein